MKKELQDELTPEFLSWVLGEDVIWVNNKTVENNIGYRRHSKIAVNGTKSIDLRLNADTLTRLCLEKIESKGYIYNLFNSTSIQGYVMIIGDRKVVGRSILEVVIKQGKYVMEKSK